MVKRYRPLLAVFTTRTLTMIRVLVVRTTEATVPACPMILGPSAVKIWPRAIDLAYALLWTAAALTVYTGLAYFRASFAHVRKLPAAPQPRRGELA